MHTFITVITSWNAPQGVSNLIKLNDLTDLITEDLDLAGSSVDEVVGARAEVIRVDLQV